MKYFDLIGQSLILLFTAGHIIYFYSDPQWPVYILLGQLLLGPWQLISSAVSVISKTPFSRQKRLHLKLSLVYLFLLFAFVFSNCCTWPAFAIKLFATIPAWSLGLYYYTLTWKWVLPRRRNRGKFLPNLSF